MKSLQLTIFILILAVSLPSSLSYVYQYKGGFQDFNSNTDANLNLGINAAYDYALNYQYAELLQEYHGAVIELTQESCEMAYCLQEMYCSSVNFYQTATDNVCVLLSGEIPYFTAIQHKVPRASNINITLAECSAFCDNADPCNLFEYYPGDPNTNDGAFCALFNKFSNATFSQAVTVDTSCGNSCLDAWYERAPQCKSIQKGVPNSYCQYFCTFTDSTKQICTGVQPFMSQICECNNIVKVSSTCTSLSPSVPNDWCLPYCHISGNKCTVDAHMSTICKCNL